MSVYYENYLDFIAFRDKNIYTFMKAIATKHMIISRIQVYVQK